MFRRQLFKNVFLVLLALSFNNVAFAAAENGTAEEAKAMVKKGVAFLKENGKEKFLAEASNKKGKLVDRDLYLSVYNPEGIVVAHGANEKLITKNVSTLNDTDGKFFIKDILSKSKADGKGIVDYKWPHPVTKEYQAKSTYFEMVDGLVIACGYYKF